MPSGTQRGMSSELFERRLNDQHHPLMEELILCLVEMEENEGTEHESEACNQQRRVETRQQHDLHVVCIDGTRT